LSPDATALPAVRRSPDRLLRVSVFSDRISQGRAVEDGEMPPGMSDTSAEPVIVS
jgi:hypothetical protein